MGMASLTKINIVYHYVYNCAREIYRSHVVVLVSLGHKEDGGDQEGEAFGGGDRPPDTVHVQQKGQQEDGTGLEQDILEGWDELQERQSLEARLAHDADQLDLICNLKAELNKGNKFAADWLESAVKRLRSPQAQALCEVILRTDHNRWWYGRVDKKWWVDRK